MARVMVRIGSVFATKLDNDSKKYFQYVANDATMLNSQVIRVFKQAYPFDAKPELGEVVSDEVEFYAHVVIRWGIQMNLWEKVGNAKDVGRTKVLFRGSWDYGNPEIKKSEDWHVWRINEPLKEVGKLEGEDQHAEIGVVVSPVDIVHRMRTGEYNFVYPGY